MSEKANKTGSTVTKISVFVFLLILFVLAKDDAGKWYQKVAARLGRERPVFAANAWKRWNFGEMSFETPFEFKSGMDQAHQLPQSLRSVLAAAEAFEGHDPYDCFHVSVFGAKFKQNLQYNIDNAVKGAMASGAGRFGDHNPVYSSEPVNAGGTEMRRVRYKKDYWARSIHIDGLFARHGQKIWLVVVTYYADDAAPDAQRILSSLRVSGNVR